ncbi:MAG: hypothetical protein JO030_01140 [Candidatus Eremiobacteraeota bacterium]|nr:hypothetical protein [Candidatus Eremiobacteraeota bacterium]
MFPTRSLCVAAVAALCIAPALARPRATPTPAPTPTPVADPAIDKLVRAQFVQWQAGIVNKSLYAQQVLDKLSDATIAQTSKALAQLGALTEMVYLGPWIEPDFPPGARGYVYQMRCVSGNIYLWLALDPQGKIATILFKNRLDVETVTARPSPPAASPNP